MWTDDANRELEQLEHTFIPFYSKKLLIKNTVNLSTSWFYAKTLGKKNVCVLWTKTSTIVTTAK